MKKTLSLLVAVALVVSLFATAGSASAASATAGETLKAFGVIKGDTSGSLNETSTWDKQDLAVLISRLVGKEEVAAATAKSHTFADVADDYYDGYISWALANKYITGISATEFGFNQPVSYKVLNAVILRVLGYDTTGANYDNTEDLAVSVGISEATDFDAAAIRGIAYGTILKALYTNVKDTTKTLGLTLNIAAIVAEAKAAEEKAAADKAAADKKAAEEKAAAEKAAAEAAKPKIESVTAVTKKTITVNFDQEVGTVLASNFKVVNKATSAVQVISSVAVSGKVVTISLVSDLTDAATYVVTGTNIINVSGKAFNESTSGEVAYTVAVPATIAFTKTTVANGSALGFVIKDAKGNDITANYTAASLTFASSNAAVVNNGTAAGVGNAIVKATLTGTEISTGNVIVTVKASLAVLTAISTVTLNATTDLTLYTDSSATTLAATVADQDGNAIASGVTYTFVSQSPTVAVVNAADNKITPVAAGTAKVLVSATYDGVTLTKTVDVAVKAAKAATTISLDKTAVNVVKGSGIANTVAVKVLDQYGNVYTPAASITVAGNSATAIAQVTTNGSTYVNLNTTAQTIALSSGEGTISLKDLSNGTAGTQTVTVTAGTLTKTFTISLVDAGTFAGYKVVSATNTTLDIKAGSTTSTASIKVYAVDTNGNYTTDATVNATISVDANATVSGATVTGTTVGSVVVKASINGLAVGTTGLTVVNSTPVLTTVTQTANAISVAASTNITANVIAAFAGKNQTATAFTIVAADIQAITANSGVVSISGSTISSVAAGTTTLTLMIKGSIYTLTVVVQ